MKKLLLYSVVLAALTSVFLVARPKEEKERLFEIEGEEDPDAERHDQPPVYLNKTTSSNYLSGIAQIGLFTEAGAINCLVISETDSNLILAGSQNGGVWRSVNRGKSWLPVDDFANSLKVSSLVQNHFKHNEYYYSTGVNIYQNNVLLHDIYRSTDGGLTFSNITSAAPSFGLITEIIPSPMDSNTVYFSQYNSTSTSGGCIWRTTDNFNTFQKVFQAAALLDDFMVLPNGEVMVCESNRIWKSATGALNTYVQSNTGIGTNVTRMKIAACSSQPLTRYAFTAFGNYYGMYKTLNGGTSWTFLDTIAIGAPSVIEVKPNDPNFVICGSVHLYVTTNGGSTWQNTEGGYDNRSINYDPHRPGIVFVTSDFGVNSIEVSPVTATSFTAVKMYDSTLRVQEVYTGDYYSGGVRAVMGCQDIGSRLIENNLNSVFLQGGDGAYAFCSKQDSNLGYYSYQGGRIMRSTILSNTTTGQYILNQLDADNNYAIDEGATFIHPYVMNDADGQQLYFPTLKRLWRSLDGGNNWTPVSKFYGSNHYKMFIVATKKPDPIVYWCHTDSIYVLKNAKTVAPLSEIGLPTPGQLGSMVLDPNNDSCLFYIRIGVPYQILHSSKFFTGPVQWTDIGANFPAKVTPACIAARPGDPDFLIVGSVEGGIYISVDGGQNWSKEGGFPNVQIKDIKIRPSDNKVFIFTFGRGVWAADLPAPVNVVEPAASQVAVYPNPFKDIIRLHVGEPVRKAEVCLLSLNGALVYRRVMDLGGEVTIDPGLNAPGTYILTIRSGNRLLLSQKMISL